jgi:hypothetical protein
LVSHFLILVDDQVVTTSAVSSASMAAFIAFSRTGGNEGQIAGDGAICPPRIQAIKSGENNHPSENYFGADFVAGAVNRAGEQG